MVRLAQAVRCYEEDQAQQQQQKQQLSTTSSCSSSPALQAYRQASGKQHAHSGAECAGCFGAAGQAQQQQQDAQAALQSYEARGPRWAARRCAAQRGLLPPPCSPERGADGHAAPAPAGATAGNGERPYGDRGAASRHDGFHIQKPDLDPDPDPVGDPGRKPRPAGRAPALQVAVRALLAQAALLRAQGLRVAAEAAEDEALVLDPLRTERHV